MRPSPLIRVFGLRFVASSSTVRRGSSPKAPWQISMLPHEHRRHRRPRKPGVPHERRADPPWGRQVCHERPPHKQRRKGEREGEALEECEQAGAEGGGRVS